MTSFTLRVVDETERKILSQSTRLYLKSIHYLYKFNSTGIRVSDRCRHVCSTRSIRLKKFTAYRVGNISSNIK